jgi:S-adenosylmethionine:tRNA ribosyltransferase-isomerase
VNASRTVPLPPYIRKGREEVGDRERYQTVYAETPGSVAAPTAGLHFTPDVFAALYERGVSTADVTLHVGLGTFAPVKAADPTRHAIHAEWCEVTGGTAAAVNATRQAGGKCVAVGTTTARTLETAAASGEVTAFRGDSSLFLYPPRKLQVVDALLTNFHLPRTTLLLLVQCLTGPELLRHAYAEAVAREYRFFSYGDAMLVLP